MSRIVGHVGEVRPPNRLRSYKERLKLYLAAYKMAADDASAGRRKAIFLSEVRRQIFHVFSDLFKPADKIFAELLKFVMAGRCFRCGKTRIRRAIT